MAADNESNQIRETPAARLQKAIIKRLRSVIDPETNADVIRMRLVKNLEVDDGGNIRYCFQPSSPLCPIAVFLAGQIKNAISEVPGVITQQISVEGYIAADELTNLLNTN